MSTPLHILHLTAGSDAGGVSRYLFDLCGALHARGHEVRIAGEHGAWRELFAHAPYPWIELPLKGNPLALWQSTRALRELLQDWPADVIHAHYRRCSLVARRLQRGNRPPLLFTLHQPGISLAGPRRWLSDFGDHVHVPSAMARQWLIDRAGLPASRITLIPHGVDPAKFPIVDAAQRAAARAALNVPQDARVAAFVGRLDVPKNEDWLIDLATAAHQRLPNLKILIAGDGPHEAAMREAIASRQLADRVFLLGYRDPRQIYHAADALLVPSEREGFCLAAAEAMSAGLPVLRTATGGAAEQIIEGITGQTRPVDREAFVAAALTFLSDVEGLRKMGAAAAEHVRANLQFDMQVERTVELYRRLADKIRNPNPRIPE
jgi:glycosyltransferase involved in cell wall biosynthesis